MPATKATRASAPQGKKRSSSLREQASIALLRTAAAWEVTVDRMLEPHGITITQYNVLRILRGAGKDGLCRNEIRDRLVNRMPDATRLLDRMEDAELISRERSTTDRRMVVTQLTKKGRTLVDALDAPVAAEHARRIGHLSDDQLESLEALLALYLEGLD